MTIELKLTQPHEKSRQYFVYNEQEHFIGQFIRGDGKYYFFPSTYHCQQTSELLRALADKADELNGNKD